MKRIKFFDIPNKFGGQYFWGSNSYMVDDIAYIAKVAVANFDIDGLIYNGNRIF